MTAFWPWWLGAIGLATVVAVHWLGVRRPLGVSGSFSNLVNRNSIGAATDAAKLDAALIAATRAQFGEEALRALEAAPSAPVALSKPIPPVPWAAQGMLLIGIAAGAAIAAMMHGRFGVRGDMGPTFARVIGTGWRAVLGLVGGGLLVGFGTAMAGGCTSGHGLCGTSRLQVGSLISTAAFFGAAVAVSLLMDRLVS